MSFDDFINRPKYEIEIMIKILNDYDDKRNKVTDNLLKNIQKEVPRNNIDDN